MLRERERERERERAGVCQSCQVSVRVSMLNVGPGDSAVLSVSPPQLRPRHKSQMLLRP